MERSELNKVETDPGLEPEAHTPHNGNEPQTKGSGVRVRRTLRKC